mgnify:CR=1 FL=1
MVVKNISRYPLNISADELTERFVRGDSSRSTEGSGLGLSIATSLMSLQGGGFRLTIDGDLFKVTLNPARRRGGGIKTQLVKKRFLTGRSKKGKAFLTSLFCCRPGKNRV